MCGLKPESVQKLTKNAVINSHSEFCQVDINQNIIVEQNWNQSQHSVFLMGAFRL